MKKAVKDYLIITAATIICAGSMFFFMLPGHISVASTTALALLASNFVPLPVSAITFIINAALLVAGFLLLGGEFGVKTVCTSLLIPMWLRVFELVFPGFTSIMGDPFLDLVCFLFTACPGMAILFLHNASSGGMDVVAKLLNKYLHMELGRAISLSGMAVALSSALVYDAKTVVLSVLGTYLMGLVLDHFILGLDQKWRVCIMSPKQEEIKQFILRELHSGATIYTAVGAYSNSEKHEILTIVDKSEYVRLMDYIEKTDPTAFVTVYSVHAVSYQPKPR